MMVEKVEMLELAKSSLVKPSGHFVVGDSYNISISFITV